MGLIQDVLKHLPKPGLGGFTPEAYEALHALHSGKPINDMIEWTALDAFRMRKAEDTPDGLVITVREFQLKEIK